MNFKTFLVFILIGTMMSSVIAERKFYLQDISDASIGELCDKIDVQPYIEVDDNNIDIVQGCTRCTSPIIDTLDFDCDRKPLCSQNDITLEETLVKLLEFDKLKFLKSEHKKPFRMYADQGYCTFALEPTVWPPTIIYGPQLVFTTNVSTSSSSSVSMNSGTSSQVTINPDGTVASGSNSGTNGDANSDTASKAKTTSPFGNDTNATTSSNSKGKLNSNTGSNIVAGGLNGPGTTAGSNSSSGGNMGSNTNSNIMTGGLNGNPGTTAGSNSNSGGNLGSSTGSNTQTANPYFNYGYGAPNIPTGGNSFSNSGGNMGSNTNSNAMTNPYFGGFGNYGMPTPGQTATTSSSSGGNLGSKTGSNIGGLGFGAPTNAGSFSNTTGKMGSDTNSDTVKNQYTGFKYGQYGNPFQQNNFYGRKSIFPVNPYMQMHRPVVPFHNLNAINHHPKVMKLRKDF